MLDVGDKLGDDNGQVSPPLCGAIPIILHRGEHTEHRDGVLLIRRPVQLPETAEPTSTEVGTDLAFLHRDLRGIGVHPQEQDPAQRHQDPQHLHEQGRRTQNRRSGRSQNAHQQLVRTDHGRHPLLPLTWTLRGKALQREERRLGIGVSTVRTVHIPAPLRSPEPGLPHPQDHPRQVLPPASLGTCPSLSSTRTNSRNSSTSVSRGITNAGPPPVISSPSPVSYTLRRSPALLRPVRYRPHRWWLHGCSP